MQNLLAETLAGQRPVCPAGHLPHLGGDRQLQRAVYPARFVIGEMPGRAEGARRIATESLLFD
ncbi:MAG: hypothetical protein EOR84_30810 [Mesorhizobium sp.]|nr:MAG: hypothetical protein EOR84_30810 [Mesorhizobium sp.]